MRHRHLEVSNISSLPVIDDIIGRGKINNWLELLTLLSDSKNPLLLSKIKAITAAHPDPYEQSYRFFENYIEYIQEITQTKTNLLRHCIDLKSKILEELKSSSEWQSDCIHLPKIILGNLHGIETGIRQLILTHPLETTSINIDGIPIRLPTSQEILRIKGILILKRNARRDHLDFAALSDCLEVNEIKTALLNMDDYYPQKNNESTLQKLMKQTSHPLPYDLDEVHISNYKNLIEKWHNWNDVAKQCKWVTNTIGHQLTLITQNKVKTTKKHKDHER